MERLTRPKVTEAEVEDWEIKSDYLSKINISSASLTSFGVIYGNRVGGKH